MGNLIDDIYSTVYDDDIIIVTEVVLRSVSSLYSISPSIFLSQLTAEHVENNQKNKPKFTKEEMTCYPPTSIILPDFITLHQPTLEISITKNLQTNKVD